MWRTAVYTTVNDHEDLAESGVTPYHALPYHSLQVTQYYTRPVCSRLLAPVTLHTALSNRMDEAMWKAVILLVVLSARGIFVF